MRELQHHCRPARIRVTLGICLALMLMPRVATRDADAHPTHPGKWTAPSAPWHAPAVNLVLLPGFAPNYHSRLLWWSHDNDHPVSGGIWGWNAPADASVNSGTFPSASFVDLDLEEPPLQADGRPTDIFCSGQTMLPDGRLLVTGGNEGVEIGTKSALLFDPAATVNGDWVVADSMAFRRWYSDNTVLPDGRVVTVTGSSYAHYASVGGIYDGAPDAPTNQLQRFGVASPGQWEQSVVPTEEFGTVHGPLSPLSDAGAATVDEKTMFLFGGKDAAGDLSNSAYRIKRDEAAWATDYAFQWSTLGANTSPQEVFPLRLRASVLPWWRPRTHTRS